VIHTNKKYGTPVVSTKNIDLGMKSFSNNFSAYKHSSDKNAPNAADTFNPRR
jgi:hypothetical protein